MSELSNNNERKRIHFGQDLTDDVLAPGKSMFDDLTRFLPDGMTLNGWAVSAGVNRTIWADIRRHGNPSRKTLEKLLTAAGSSLAEFEALRVGERSVDEGHHDSVGIKDRSGPAWTGASPAPIPLIATNLCDDLITASGAVGMMALGATVPGSGLPRPAIVANDAGAFAIVMTDRSMWPRFRTGRFLIVSPAAPIAVGDDILVRLAGQGDRVLVKQLEMRTKNMVRMRQFTPDREFDVPADDIVTIEKVVGEAL